MGKYTDLRQLIIDTLGSELGKYVFSKQQEVPAITIASNQRYPKAGTKILGLEVVVYPNVQSDITGMLGSKLVKRETRVVLNQWDLTKDTTIAHDLLLANLPNIFRVGPRLMADGDKQTIESQTFYLSESTVINWRRS